MGLPAVLRRDCKCASCVEELTGRQILTPQSVPDSVWPMSIVPCGNYALSVDWSDGHRSLYPYKQIRALMEIESSGSDGSEVNGDNGHVMTKKKEEGCCGGDGEEQ